MTLIISVCFGVLLVKYSHLFKKNHRIPWLEEAFVKYLDNRNNFQSYTVPWEPYVSLNFGHLSPFAIKGALGGFFSLGNNWPLSYFRMLQNHVTNCVVILANRHVVNSKVIKTLVSEVFLQKNKFLFYEWFNSRTGSSKIMYQLKTIKKQSKNNLQISFAKRSRS